MHIPAQNPTLLQDYAKKKIQIAPRLRQEKNIGSKPDVDISNHSNVIHSGKALFQREFANHARVAVISKFLRMPLVACLLVLGLACPLPADFRACCVAACWLYISLATLSAGCLAAASSACTDFKYSWFMLYTMAVILARICFRGLHQSVN